MNGSIVYFEAQEIQYDLSGHTYTTERKGANEEGGGGRRRRYKWAVN